MTSFVTKDTKVLSYSIKEAKLTETTKETITSTSLIRHEIESLKPLDEDAPISDDNATKIEKCLTEKEKQQLYDAVNAYFS